MRRPGPHPDATAIAEYQRVLDRVYAGSGRLLSEAPTWQSGLYQSVRSCYSVMRSNPRALEMHFVTTARDAAVQRTRTRHRDRLLGLLFAIREDVPEPVEAELVLSMIHATMRAHIVAREDPPDLDEADQTFAAVLFNAVPSV